MTQVMDEISCLVCCSLLDLSLICEQGSSNSYIQHATRTIAENGSWQHYLVYVYVYVYIQKFINSQRAWVWYQEEKSVRFIRSQQMAQYF